MQGNFDEICLNVVELSRQVGEFLMEEKGKISSKDIETKGRHDYVTYVDKTAEKYLVEGLSKILPPAGFITEEGTIDKKSDTLNSPLKCSLHFCGVLVFLIVSSVLMLAGWNESER